MTDTTAQQYDYTEGAFKYTELHKLMFTFDEHYNTFAEAALCSFWGSSSETMVPAEEHATIPNQGFVQPLFSVLNGFIWTITFPYLNSKLNHVPQ